MQWYYSLTPATLESFLVRSIRPHLLQWPITVESLVSLTVFILLKSQNKLLWHLRLYPSKSAANSGYVNVWPNFSKYSLTLLKGRVKWFWLWETQWQDNNHEQIWRKTAQRKRLPQLQDHRRIDGFIPLTGGIVNYSHGWNGNWTLWLSLPHLRHERK